MPVGTKAALVYTIASFITRGFSFITTPLFTRIMSVEQMGVVSNFSTWQGFISDVVTLGLVSGAVNIALKDYKEDRLGFLKNAQFLILLGVLTGGLVIGLCYPILEPVMKMPFHYIPLMFVSVFLGASKSLWMSLNRYEFRYKAVGLVVVAYSVLSAGLSVLAVILAKANGVEDLSSVRLYTSNMVLLVIALPIAIKFFANKKPLVRKEYCSFALTVAAPMIVHTLSKTILSASDRTMINAMEGAEAQGYYSVLYTLSSLVLIFWDAIHASLVPYIFGKLGEGKEGERDVSRVVTTMLLVFAVASLLFILFAPEIVWIIASEKYMQSIYIMPPIAIGTFFISIYSLYSNLLMYHKKTKWVMFATTGAAVFNLVTNFIFIRIFGYVAAAYTTLASYMLLALIYCICAKKVHGHSIYSDKWLWSLALGLTGLGLLCNILYLNHYIRYAVIAVILIFVVIYRRKILEVYKIMKGKHKKV